jgi:hypothetical protein
MVSRRNANAVLTGLDINPRVIPVQLVFRGTGAGIWADKNALLALLDVENPMPRKLVAIHDDGSTLIELNAICVLDTDVPDSANQLNVVFYSEDYAWREQTAVVSSPVTVAANTYGGPAFSVGGSARTRAKLRVAPSGVSSQAVTVRTFSITNNGEHTITNEPWRVPLGDTYDGVAHPSFYFALLRDGKPQRMALQNMYGRNMAYIWVVIDHLPVGQTANYQFLLSNNFPDPGFSIPNSYFDSYAQPAFDIDWYGQVVTTNTTTVHTFPAPGTWEVDKWKYGMLRYTTGPNAGLERPILSNTATTITTTAFPSPSTGQEALVTMSSNGHWVWPVRRTDRNDTKRGLWWISSGQSNPNLSPSQIRQDVPGSWATYAYMVNNDEYSQESWTAQTIGGNDKYFAIPHVHRSWQGGVKQRENKNGDGAIFTIGHPITKFTFDFEFLNPTRMCQVMVGGRPANAEDFSRLYTHNLIYDTMTLVSPSPITISGDVLQLYVGLLPRSLDEIGADWARDSGSATSGSTTQLNDNTKSWSSSQWIGARLRIKSGTGAGQVRTVSASSPNTLTPSPAFSTAPDTTSQYELIQAPIEAEFKSGSSWVVDWDPSGVVISPVSAPVTGYILERDIFVGRSLATDPPPYQVIRTHHQYTGRYLLLFSGEELVIDGASSRAWIESGGVEVRPVPPKALQVVDVDADGFTYLAESWLWLRPGNRSIKIAPLTGDNAYTLKAEWREGYLG